jgi:hypothetical protein
MESERAGDEKFSDQVAEKQKIQQQILVRVTTDEKKIITARAKKLNKSISRYLVDGALLSQNLSPEETQEFIFVQKRALFHVRQIGEILKLMIKNLGVDRNRLKELDAVLIAQARALRALRDAIGKK